MAGGRPFNLHALDCRPETPLGNCDRSTPHFGFEVAVAYTSPDGLATAKRDQPDVVVCDIGLPGMDGYAIATALRKNGKWLAPV